MEIQSNRASKSITPILNRNRIVEPSERDAILAMGISICQVGCMGGGQAYRYHRARH
jgi:hypothetical protein